MNLKKIIFSLSIIMTLIIPMIGCVTSEKKQKELNIYSGRHYPHLDEKIYKMFTKKTGIKINETSGKIRHLIEKLSLEGKNTKVDLLISNDAAALYIAKEKGLLQGIDSKILNENIPAANRDEKGFWFGLTKRARIIAYNPNKINPKRDGLHNYEDLSNPKWKKSLLIRSSSNYYNQSLLASIIAANGKDKSKKWTQAVFNNLARSPKGNDRDQARAIHSGIGNIAIMNSYYVYKLRNSKDPKDRAVGQSIKMLFPNQENRGVHVNISGSGITKYATNKANAIQFIEFTSSPEIQQLYGQENYEYPVHPKVKNYTAYPKDIIMDSLKLDNLGKNNKEAVKIFKEIRWP